MELINLISKLITLSMELYSLKLYYQNCRASLQRKNESKEVLIRWEKERVEYYNEIQLCKAKMRKQLKQIEQLIK